MWPSWRREARLLKTGTNNPDRGQRDAMETPVLDTDDVINKSRIGRLQIRVAVLGALILFVDGFDTQVIGYIAPRIASDWNISRDVLGWILAADKIGLLIGYLFVSPLSGYFGHKRVGIGCIAMFGFLACLTTTASDPLELFFLRLLTGIGLGGTIPSGNCRPARCRARCSTLTAGKGRYGSAVRWPCCSLPCSRSCFPIRSNISSTAAAGPNARRGF